MWADQFRALSHISPRNRTVVALGMGVAPMKRDRGGRAERYLKNTIEVHFDGVRWRPEVCDHSTVLAMKFWRSG
jgi:hypothetical protein